MAPVRLKGKKIGVYDLVTKVSRRITFKHNHVKLPNIKTTLNPMLHRYRMFVLFEIRKQCVTSIFMHCNLRFI